MNRPKYKNLFFKMRSEKNMYKDALDNVLNTLKNFKNIEVIDKLVDVENQLGKVRVVELKQNKKGIQMGLNTSLFEEE